MIAKVSKWPAGLSARDRQRFHNSLLDLVPANRQRFHNSLLDLVPANRQRFQNGLLDLVPEIGKGFTIACWT
jgi:hypothetical protein